MTRLQRYRPSSLAPRWNVFDDVLGVQRDINRLFGDFFGRTDTYEDRNGLMWAPPVDVIENTDELVVRAELPGMKREDINVSVEGNTLVLSGERNYELDEDKDNVHRVERSYGAFRRMLALPSTVDPDQVEASYRDGVLEIHLAKREEARPRLVEVKTA